jgi:SAM-dependent methyltransferase
MDVSIESSGISDGGAYDGRAAAYDRLVGSRLYNRLAWGTDPAEYAAFARRAVTSASGPLLDVAAGTATATAILYRISNRAITITDRSTDMLRLAAERIAGSAELRPGRRFVQADAFDLPFEGGGFDTVLCLGFLHLVDDPVGFVDGLRAQARPGGRVFISSLVAGHRVGDGYLRLLHRLGEVATPRTANELADLFHAPALRHGSMAYLELDC